MGTKSLDTLTSNLEQALKRLRSGGAVTRKRMALDEFFDHAVAEIAKAAEDEPDVAKRRLAALKRSVEEVIAQVAKMAAEDTDSESIQVEVATAFAPTRSDGDTPMADLTTAADQSSVRDIAVGDVGGERRHRLRREPREDAQGADADEGGSGPRPRPRDAVGREEGGRQP